MMPTQAQIEQALQNIPLPFPGVENGLARALRSVSVLGANVAVQLQFGFPVKGIEEAIRGSIAQVLTPLGVHSFTAEMTSVIVSHAVQNGVAVIPGVKNTIAIASGKGGVGKSTVAVNMALALAYQGAAVGILDADIYGPSLPWMLGAPHHPMTAQNSFTPVLCYGVQSMSMGYLVQEKMPVIWRGPMVSGALQQLCYQTKWGHLDYLFIDLPPGTGDIHLTLAQKIPVTGAIIVTTPQDVALLDAQRAVGMFNKLHIPILGIVENMSAHHCPACGHVEAIFGHGGGKNMSQEMAVTFLGSVPLATSIQQDVDKGAPTVARDPEGALGRQYQAIARLGAARLSLHSKNYAIHFPKVVVESQQGHTT